MEENNVVKSLNEARDWFLSHNGHNCIASHPAAGENVRVCKTYAMASEYFGIYARKRYLGDSVYVEMENGMLKLTTNNGYDDDPRNVIFLEQRTYQALLNYVITN